MVLNPCTCNVYVTNEYVIWIYLWSLHKSVSEALTFLHKSTKIVWAEKVSLFLPSYIQMNQNNESYIKRKTVFKTQHNTKTEKIKEGETYTILFVSITFFTILVLLLLWECRLTAILWIVFFNAVCVFCGALNNFFLANALAFHHLVLVLIFLKYIYEQFLLYK